MRIFTISSLVALLALSACGGSPDASPVGPTGGPACGALTLVTPRLSVTDKTTGKPICDADAESGGRLLPASTDPDSCTYNAQGEDSHFKMTITAPGFATAEVQGLSEWECGCGQACAAPEVVSVALTPL
jgi:hypothetical protein